MMVTTQHLPEMETFTDVLVTPFRQMYKQPFFGDGGPVWPDFAKRGAPRHNRDGSPVDHLPSASDETPDRLERAAVWGGYGQPQFGHLVAEQLTRLPVSLVHRPDDVFLFTVHKAKVKAPPEYFYDLCAWYGLAREQIMLVKKPIMAKVLRVAPQAEQLNQWPPAPYALKMADEAVERNAVTAIQNEVVYVARSGLGGPILGALAGEGYLVERLQEAGVTVIEPGQMTISDQVAHYIGSRILVFAEGSAIHGRQLAGYRPQDIVVLNRRPGARTGQAALTPRCDSLTYVEASQKLLFMRRDGTNSIVSGLSVMDLDQIFPAFAQIGIDLSLNWDAQAYDAAVQADLRRWVDHFRNTWGNELVAQGSQQLLETLTEMGWSLDEEQPPQHDAWSIWHGLKSRASRLASLMRS